MEIATANESLEGLLFDWKLDVERLEREARAAAQARQPNDWALVEAECSQDLIASELKALEARKDSSEATARTIQHLKEWERRVERVIKQLRSLTAQDARLAASTKGPQGHARSLALLRPNSVVGAGDGALGVEHGAEIAEPSTKLTCASAASFARPTELA
jgi:chromosome segregation ATPase